MTQTQSQTLSLPAYKRIILLLGFILLMFLFLSGCSSTCHSRRSHMFQVLDEQNDLIAKIIEERGQPKIARETRRVPALSHAERHLEEALHALRESNQTLRSAIEPEASRKGDQ